MGGASPRAERGEAQRHPGAGSYTTHCRTLARVSRVRRRVRRAVHRAVITGGMGTVGAGVVGAKGAMRKALLDETCQTTGLRRRFERRL